MTWRSLGIRTAVTIGLLAAMAPVGTAQSGAETFNATATVKTSGGTVAKAPIRIVVDRKMPQAEIDKYAAAFKTGGAAALRQALAGIAPAGSVTLGAAASTPVRIAFERRTDKGRLLTIVADRPILFVGAGVPGAKPKEGYDFAVIDLEVNDQGQGSGVMSPAAKVGLNQGAFVVTDYSAEQIQLVGVSRAK